jgi:hypothetical protein
MAACGIAPEDDDGHAASKPVTYEKPSKPAPRMTDEAAEKSNGSRSAKAAVATNDADEALPW